MHIKWSTIQWGMPILFYFLKALQLISNKAQNVSQISWLQTCEILKWFLDCTLHIWPWKEMRGLNIPTGIPKIPRTWA